MKELAARISALAPEAGNALRVIEYFDGLVKHGAGIKAIVRGTAALSGHSAVFVDRAVQGSIAFGPDGSPLKADAVIPSSWFQTSSRDGSLRIGLETDTSEENALDALILERALLAASTSLGRPLDVEPHDKSAWVRLLVDENADMEDRMRALGNLRLQESSTVCIAAVSGGTPILATSIDKAIAEVAGQRAGIGPLVPGRDAAASWKRAWLALRLTAEGTPEDPGDRIVRADEVGSLIDVVEAIEDSAVPLEDVAALALAHTQVPWVYETIDTLTRTSSLREAALLLHVHHSTLQERLTRLEKILGWSQTTPQGRFRSYLALNLRRALRSHH